MTAVEENFGVRFAPLRKRLLAYAVALTHDHDLAGDLVQESVSRAMSAPQRPASEAAFRAWMFKILRNLWIDEIRASKRRREIETGMQEAASAMPLSMESVIVSAFAVRQALAVISHDHREILALVDVSGLTYEEASSVLDIPKGTVMSRVSRARQALIAVLEDEGQLSHQEPK